MKLLRYGPVGAEHPGLLHGDGTLRDLSGVIDDLMGLSLTAHAIEQLMRLDAASLPIVPGAPRIASPVAQVGKMVCVGLNYADHAAEAGMSIPEQPVLFMKATSAIVGPNDDLVIPRGCEKTDWEVELGVVIGDVARRVTRAEAPRHIAGYVIVHDVSERAFQLEQGGQWVKGKSCDTFGPTGPWLVTRDEVKDPQGLSMWLDVNGRRYQRGNTRTMIFDVAHLVSYISRYMTLMPGDIISTGTPPGVGMGQKPQVFLKPGDVVELGIEGLGQQRQHVVAAP
ncbi:MAG: fumarylacetoacetate hydrolase family protein [Steroidobacteraceae bacterium]|jgi:2,4-didehydro-3-deoxy-L-rhamnonate hydrolase